MNHQIRRRIGTLCLRQSASFTSGIMLLALGLLLLATNSHAWSRPSLAMRRPFIRTETTFLSLAATSLEEAPTNEQEEDDDDEEYEYIELENLTEEDFLGSEWLVGTIKNEGNKIEETWCRLAVDPQGNNCAIWGDGSTGRWSVDVATQYVSFSKDYLLKGKEIWACTADDYYYLQGTVRGWKYWSAASVIGQWQARRLGVDKEEAGVAPWFEENDEGDDEPTAAALEATTAEEVVATTEPEIKMEAVAVEESVTEAPSSEATVKLDSKEEEPVAAGPEANKEAMPEEVVEPPVETTKDSKSDDQTAASPEGETKVEIVSAEETETETNDSETAKDETATTTKLESKETVSVDGSASSASSSDTEKESEKTPTAAEK